MALAISTSTLSGDGKSGLHFLSPSSFSVSSTSSFSDLSPLPSPHLKPKTSAFFSTPNILAPSSPEPERKSKNSSFFSPPWSPSSVCLDLPGPSTHHPPRRSSSGSTTFSIPEVHLTEASRSATVNESFFASHTLPTPPPSTYSESASSREPSPSRPSPNKPRFPPFSSLFSSRFNAPSSPERGFIDIDQTPRPTTEPWGLDDVFSASPTSAEFPAVTYDRPERRIVSTPNPIVRAPSPSPLRSPALPRETTHVDDKPEVHLHPGSVISSASGRRAFHLIRELGQGAFSSVWLSSVVSTFHERTFSGSMDDHALMEGTRPIGANADLNNGEGEASTPAMEGQLVAVKLTDRKLFEINDRTRVSFVREVEVLKHISHRNIVSYIASFTTPTHHCLALENVNGGELFDLINSDENHARLDEPRLRRVFGELSKAVEFMHGVGLVHRDIKLENILLTSNILAGELPPVKTPLLKLTDFGLARFIDPAQPLLATRCGSESYAAPELVTGSQYDARQTDAWACGVVLFALAVRQLPFDPHSPGVPFGQVNRDRRKMLVKIANADYSWPGLPPFGDDADADAACLAGTTLARSPGVRRLVGRLLVRNPERRSTMAMLWEDEWMWGEGAPVAPATASRSGSLSRKSSRMSRKSIGRTSRRRETSPLQAEGLPSLLASHFAVGPSPLIQAYEGLPVVDDADVVPIAASPDAVVPEEDPEDGDEEIEVEEHGSLVDAGTIGEIARQELR